MLHFCVCLPSEWMYALVCVQICVCFSSSCDSRVITIHSWQERKKKDYVYKKVDVCLSCRDLTNGFELEMSRQGGRG